MTAKKFKYNRRIYVYEIPRKLKPARRADGVQNIVFFTTNMQNYHQLEIMD